jgi:hypothetical protein
MKPPPCACSVCCHRCVWDARAVSPADRYECTHAHESPKYWGARRGGDNTRRKTTQLSSACQRPQNRSPRACARPKGPTPPHDQGCERLSLLALLPCMGRPIQADLTPTRVERARPQGLLRRSTSGQRTVGKTQAAPGSRQRTVTKRERPSHPPTTTSTVHPHPIAFLGSGGLLGGMVGGLCLYMHVNGTKKLTLPQPVTKKKTIS